MNWEVAPQSINAGPDLTSPVSVVWISTLTTSDLGPGVDAIMYLQGSLLSHFRSQR